MATQYTSILKLALPVQGELSGTWGDVVNDNITSMVEEAIAGRAVINTWTANSHTLTTANGTTSESRCAMLEFTDTGVALTGAGEVICPAQPKIYIAKNASGQAITVKTSAGTGIAVQNGETKFVFCDGTNVVEAVTSMTTLKVGTGVQVSTILDEDNMASDSATALATQQSIKAYVDAQVTAQDLDFAGDTGTGAVDLDSQSLTVAGTANEIETSASGQTLTVGLPAAIIVTTSVTTPTVQTTNLNANDGSPAATIADATGVVTVNSAVLTTADINGGTADNVVIGGTTAAAGSFTTVNASGNITSSGQVITNTINEQTATSGVTVDGVLLKDGGATLTGDLVVDTNTLYVDTTNNRVGIQTSTPSTPLDVRANLSTVYTGTAQSAEHINIFNIGTGAVGLTSGIRYQTRALDATGQAFFTGASASSGGYAPSYVFQQQVAASTYREVMAFAQSEAVFNNPGNDYDFRVESDTNTHALFLNGANGYFGLGESSPQSFLHVSGSGSNGWLYLNNTDATADHVLYFRRQNSNVAYLGLLSTDQYWLNGSAASKVVLQQKAATELVINESSVDADFRVESDANANMIFVDAGSSEVGIGTGSPASTLDVAGTTTTKRLLVVDDGSTSPLVNIKADDQGPWAFQIQNDTYYNGDLYGFRGYMENGGAFQWQHKTSNFATVSFKVSNTSTTLSAWEYNGGFGSVFNQDSNADMDFRVESDTNTHMLFVDAGANHVNIGGSADYGGTFNVITTQTGNALTVNSTDASATHGPNIRVFRDSASPADNDYIGRVNFDGKNDGGASITYAQVLSQILDVSAGTEDARLKLGGLQGGTFVNYFDAIATETVINEDGVDRDFRVESGVNPHMLFVDAGKNVASLGMTSASIPAWLGNNSVVVADNVYGFQGASYANACYNISVDNNYTYFLHNGYYGAGGWTQRLAGFGNAMYRLGQASHQWEVAADVGTDDTSITWRPLMNVSETNGFIWNENSYNTDFRVESNANSSMLFVDASADAVGIGTNSPNSAYGLNVSVAKRSALFYKSSSSDGDEMFQVTWDTSGYPFKMFVGASGAGYSTNNAVMWVPRSNSTSRSINASGTINASGADYAEYMVKADTSATINKGDVCGIDVNGNLTTVWADAISFVVKSTDPSYVGGDTWFNGEMPPEDDAPQSEKDAFEARKEAARATVDRIAFSGQVPVNVTGATVGDFIIPVQDGTGITGQAVSNPTFDQYMAAVGKVIAIEADGRAKIIVKVA